MKIYIVTDCDGTPLKCFVNRNKAIRFLKDASLKDLDNYYDENRIQYKEFQETPDNEYHIAYANFYYKDLLVDPDTGEESDSLGFDVLEIETED